MKDKYLNNEIWVLIFGGAFQRAAIYKEEYSPEVKKKFRESLRAYIEALVEIKYIVEVPEHEHIKNIKGIVKLSNINLIDGKAIPINFGVAQKLLNLHLKYLWCRDKLEHPPIHFPVDRLVQEILNKESYKLGIKKKELKAWTQFKDETEYLEVIRFAEKIRNNSKDFNEMSLAELELTLFNRR